MAIVNETIPTVVTWPEIVAQTRRGDESERTLLEGFALEAIERFELETGVAGKARNLTLVYDSDEAKLACSSCARRKGYTASVAIPKGPVVSVVSVTVDGVVLAASQYKLAKHGHAWTLNLNVAPVKTLGVVASVGHETVPQSIKGAVLAVVEHKRVLRGVVSTQAQTEFAHGLERIYEQWRTNRVVVG